MGAVTGFREAIEALVDKLYSIADNGVPDHQNRLGEIREEYCSAYILHGVQFARDLILNPEDWRTAKSMARTMAKSEGTSAREWFIERVAGKWAAKARVETQSLRLLYKVIGRTESAEAHRRMRVRLRELYDEQPDAPPAQKWAAGAPAYASAESVPGGAAHTAAAASGTESALEKDSDNELMSGQSTASFGAIPDPALLQERKAALRTFVGGYREARDYRLNYGEIAALANRGHRTIIDKYLAGAAPEEAVRNIEGVFKLSPDQVDEKCRQHKQRLPKLWDHLSKK
jgi:hypothetical protein